MKNKKTLVRIMAGFLAAVLLLGLLAMVFPTYASAKSSSVLKGELNALKEEKAEIQAEMNALEGQLKDNLSEIGDIVDQKNSIDQQVGLLYAQAENINQQISTYSLMIADKQDELDVAQSRLDVLNEQNRARIRAMEAEGSLSYWEVLFKASSFSDLLDRLNMIREIAEEDQRRIQEMNRIAEEVALAQAELAEEKSGLEISRAELDDTMAVLDVKRAEADALLAQLLAQGAELDALLDEFEQKEQDLLGEIGQKEKEYNQAKREEWLATSVPETTTRPTQSGDDDDDDHGNDGNITVGAKWIVPCSYVCVSSAYGPRTPPKKGASSWHHGVDLAGPKGTPIYASRGGTVTSATYGSASGYYVSINHGDGYSSSYLHMTHYVVKAGQQVSQGQLIGYMGSTGVSTGPHLHFSIYYNGQSKNPAHYIPI